MSRGFQADGVNEGVEVIDAALVEAVELRSAVAWKRCVGLDRREQAGGQRSVDALEELHEDEADRIALGQEPAAAGAPRLFDETFCAQFGEIVAERGEGAAIGGAAESVANPSGELGCGEAVGGGDMTEAHERAHERESPRIVELEAGRHVFPWRRSSAAPGFAMARDRPRFQECAARTSRSLSVMAESVVRSADRLSTALPTP